MNGEKKFILLMVCLTSISFTVLYTFLFIALWDYRQMVGLSLLAVGVASVLVYLRGRLHEQDLRVIRFRHGEETPLDDHGEPFSITRAGSRTRIGASPL